MNDIDVERFQCPRPLSDYPHITLGHGGGGQLSAELVQHLFLPAFENKYLANLGDAAVLETKSGRMALTTDTYVVQPLFFPGGSIGELAIHGTVNDLAMSGAKPLYLSAGFVLEEGLPMAQLGEIVQRMAAAAKQADVLLVAGDTKVVEKGRGDGCIINTTGVGFVPDGVDVAPTRAEPGDAVLLSGTVGDHGMAIMSVREGLAFNASIESDTAPLHTMVASLLAACPDIHSLRDPTRGGLATTLNEIALASQCGIVIEEDRIPVTPAVRSACEILGLDPLLVANEGKLVCVVPERYADEVLAAMRKDVFGAEAAIIGRVVSQHPGMVVAKTAVGASRVVTIPLGEQLPRIC